MKRERSAESARETREGFKVEVAFELSVEDGGLHRWEGWGVEGLQEEGQGESDSSRADGVLCKLWLGAWNLGAAASCAGSRGVTPWEVRLSTWDGDVWTSL